MTKHKHNLALVTPVKDEINNLPKLVKAIELQTSTIFLWVIIENDSTDGSAEYLKKLQKIQNVEYLVVLDLEFENKDYQLGMKYSTIIKHGFDYIQSSEYFDQLDYIGILDADCFPELDYYQKLINKFEHDSKLGIASGVIKCHDNKLEKSNPDHARGGIRLWNIKCFNDSPYEIGMSADSISSVKATLNGWKVRSFNEAIAYSRKAGSRYISTYSGLSAYYRRMPFYYVMFKSILLILKGNPKKATGHMLGYLKGLIYKEKRLNDPQLIKYFKNILFRKFSNKVSMALKMFKLN
jgi:glycosyltransferase involved in cell wall biosynthesis